MTLRLLASTCHNGDCPKLRIDDETGDVFVQGYATTVSSPDGEATVRISAAEWRALLAQLAS